MEFILFINNIVHDIVLLSTYCTITSAYINPAYSIDNLNKINNI